MPTRLLSVPRMTALLMLASVVGAAGCACSGSTCASESSVMSRAEQQAMSPDEALARLSEGNRRFVAGTSLHRDHVASKRATAVAQHPFAVVLSCIDSRVSPEIIFDQGLGDIFAPRLAGNYAQADILGGMEFATKVVGARAIVVVGHTECGAVMGACDNVEMGNLTTVIHAIRPAVDAVEGVPGDRNSGNAEFVLAATEMNVRRTVTAIRKNSPILRDLEQAGQIKIVGAMHDLETGRVTYLR